MFHVIDTNGNERIAQYSTSRDALRFAHEYVATQFIEYMLDAIDDGEDVESHEVVIRRINADTFEVFTDGGDDVVRVERAMTRDDVQNALIDACNA
jgi:hypothetical protein